MDGLSLCVPSFASTSIISFPMMAECALTLCRWILCGSNISYVQFLLCVIYSGDDVVMMGVVCSCS